MKSEIIDICPRSPSCRPAAMKMVEWEDLEIGVFNCNGEIYAIEDRCSHDNGTLVEGSSTRTSARSSARATARSSTCSTGKPLTLPAYVPVDTFPVLVEDDQIKVEVE